MKTIPKRLVLGLLVEPVVLGFTLFWQQAHSILAWVTSPVNKPTEVDRLTSSVNLRMQDIHHSDVVTGFDETVGERGPDKACPPVTSTDVGNKRLPVRLHNKLGDRHASPKVRSPVYFTLWRRANVVPG